MTTIDYAKKYSGQVIEKFKEGAKSNGVINQEFDFSGVKSVLVYNVSTPKLNDYTRTGTNRFGTPEELDARTEEMTMTQEKSFTAVIDKLDLNETQMALEAGKVLDRTIREVIVPELDRYRFAKIVEKAGTSIEETITATNVYERITEANEALDELEVPAEGRQLIVNPAVYKLLKQCKDIILDTELSDEQRKAGVIAMVDGLEIVKVPSSRLAGVNFIVTHKMATCAPVKLATYRIMEQVPGIHGYLVEGLVQHDAFVLENRKCMIYASKAPAGRAKK